MASEQELRDGLASYWTAYYRDTLGLPDWEERVASRVDEENTFGKGVVERFRDWFALDPKGRRILVVGAGTGAESFVLARSGAQVVALEPEAEALRLLRLKAALRPELQVQVVDGVAETLPFDASEFDVVLAYTVLEHVRDPEAAVREMVRVVRPHGHVLIETPDYRHWYEPHYKLLMPTFLPRFLLKAFLRLRGRPAKFIDTLQFVNARQLMTIFQELPVLAFQAIPSVPQVWKEKGSLAVRLWYWRARQGIARDQFWQLRKLEAPR